jgi:hypothetical protein
MLMPNKITRPVDSLIAISGHIISIIKDKSAHIDEIRYELNQLYPKNVYIEEIILSIDFLFLIDKIEVINNEIKLK